MSLTQQQQDILKDVRKRVLSTHWLKGSYKRTDGTGKPPSEVCGCLVGLVDYCSGGTKLGVVLVSGNRDSLFMGIHRPSARDKQLPILQALYNQINAGRKRSINSIEAWNDRKKTTREDVLELIDATLQQG